MKKKRKLKEIINEDKSDTKSTVDNSAEIPEINIASTSSVNK